MRKKSGGSSSPFGEMELDSRREKDRCSASPRQSLDVGVQYIVDTQPAAWGRCQPLALFLQAHTRILVHRWMRRGCSWVMPRHKEGKASSQCLAPASEHDGASEAEEGLCLVSGILHRAAEPPQGRE